MGNFNLEIRAIDVKFVAYHEYCFRVINLKLCSTFVDIFGPT